MSQHSSHQRNTGGLERDDGGLAPAGGVYLRFSQFVARHPWWILAAWLLLALGVRAVAPRWDDITYDGDLAYLPTDLPSVRGEELLNVAFPDNRARSQMVLVVARDDRPLDADDREVLDRLTARFESKRGLPGWPLLDIWTRDTEVVGPKLRSADKQAQLIILQLSNEFMATANMDLLELVEDEVRAVRKELAAEGPAGLTIGISGSAAVGGDMLLAAAESIDNTEELTIILVLTILLIVYRAPLLMCIPLAAIILSLSVATGVLAMLTQLHLVPGFEWWGFKVFKTTRIFIVVILYGSGTDFCLFLIARFREEIAAGRERVAAVAAAAAGVTDALLGSALTTVLGLAAMYFADFGKFRNSGPAIGLCLFVTLLACLTLAPALLSALGTWVFWPWHRRYGGASDTAATPAGTGISSTNTSERQPTASNPGEEQQTTWLFFWDVLARLIVYRPGLVLVVCGILFTPLAWHGATHDDQVTYDALAELTPDRPSRQGTALLERHFPVGEGGPIIVLAHRPGARFGDPDRAAASEALSEIYDLTNKLLEVPGVMAVRSLAEPLGDPPKRLSLLSSAGRQKLLLQNHSLTKQIFLGQGPKYEGDVTRLELLLKPDPFSVEAINILNLVDRRLADEAARADSFWSQAQFFYAGTTASIRDLRQVTRGDHRRIQVLVSLAVLAILIAILRRPVICVLLILSVIISYWVTIGTTQWFFHWLDGAAFSGLDWKVPTFLFVILVAVGEDYNIYLTTRVFEEQRRYGLADGLRRAIDQTGGVITSCGLIMAGSFISMISSSLRAMVELGFALTLGILLDTFLVRTVIVPAMLALLMRREGQGGGKEEGWRAARRQPGEGRDAEMKNEK